MQRDNKIAVLQNRILELEGDEPVSKKQKPGTKQTPVGGQPMSSKAPAAKQSKQKIIRSVPNAEQ